MSKSEYFWLAALYVCYVQAEEEFEEFNEMFFRVNAEGVMHMFELTERRRGIYDMTRFRDD